MTYQLSALLHLDRARQGLPRPQSVVLLTLLLATIVMPVNYRAGAEVEHPHTIFQGVIDAITGHHQHHHEEPDNAGRVLSPGATLTPFVPVGVPLSILADSLVQPLKVEAVSQDTDAPELLGVSMPITSLASIHALGQLVAALLAGTIVRPLWSQAPRLLNRAVGVEIPPPRLAQVPVWQVWQ
ncbi:MAG: hypothetical protein M3457_03185 [Chloroflexota bacterium]|nr:hypothetical protein [Chloroflexota bacterium]